MTTPTWDWRGIWPILPKTEKHTARLFFVFLLVSWGALLRAWLERYSFKEAFVPFYYYEEEIAPIDLRRIQYRSYLVELPVRRVYELTATQLLAPEKSAILLGWIGIVLGWAALLAAATRMQGFLPYLVYFGWVVWVHSSKTALAWAGVDPFYVVSLGLSLVVLLPTLFIQMGLWRLEMRYTVLLLTAGVASVLGLPAIWKGLGVLHDALVFPGLLGLVAAGIGALLGPLALLAVGVYVLTRRRANLLGYGLLAGLSLGLSAGIAFLPQDLSHSLTLALGLLGLIAGFIGLQPYYPLWTDGFRHPIALLWSWAGINFLTTAPLAYHLNAYQYFYFYSTIRLWQTFLGVGLLGGTLYLGLNFWALWQTRQMKYWDLPKSPRLPLALVFFLQIMVGAGLEVQENWPITRFPARWQALAAAESSLLTENWEAAEKAHQKALLFLPFESRLAYNLAHIQFQLGKELEKVALRCEEALLTRPFLPAALQAALLWLQLERPVRATQLLQRYTNRFGPNARAFNQLAFLFYKLNTPDSAAFYWKEAIRLAPANPTYYAHLALLYLRYERRQWAARVASSIPSPFPPAVAENLAYFHLMRVLPKPPPNPTGQNAQWLGLAQDTTPLGRWSAALHARKLGQVTSFLPYFYQHDRELYPYAVRYTALHFLEAGLARKAADLFLQAGTPRDSLYAAYALAEGGCWEAAYTLASRLMASYPEVEEEARREVSVLLAASGNFLEANLVEPLANWTDQDYLRFGLYTFLRGDLQTAVQGLRPWVDRGATYEAPYEWVARLFLLQKDTAAALENLSAGLQRMPTSFRLHALQAEIYLSLPGKREISDRLLDSLSKRLSGLEDTVRFYTLRLRRWGPKWLTDSLLQRLPGWKEGLAAYAQALLQQGQSAQAYEFLAKYLELDPYDRVAWRLYGEAARQLNLPDEAAFAERKPDPCPAAL
ncbi:MAG: tetratricopeptide repeat protein [Bacteroidia bacterium]|nr:tetratricopeptide repeat protein [Bacteroidia bacterium]MDW8089163.1 tetratricopeptide repeat protein [Bacteroidia bacterium]